MIGRVVALDMIGGREAAALIVDGRLEELIVDPGPDAGFRPGAILRGQADRLVKGQGGIFVRLPEGRTGFLRDIGGIAPGRPVLVQIAGAAEPGKAHPLTSRILFKSRHAIVTPGAPGLNISRRIRDDAARARLTALAAAAMAGAEAAIPGAGLILRSVAEWADDAEVADDIRAMRTLAGQVLADADGAPELLVEAPGPHEEAWRDWGDPAPDEVDDAAGAFARHGLDELIDALLQADVRLPGGGSMVIEPTRALVAVDVNTGGDTSPAAGLKANIAAARELPRQLRLRGLGGQIAVDMAPMPKKDRVAVEQQMRQALKGEGAETILAGWTPLGHLELQRKRDRVPLGLALRGAAP